MYGNSMQSMMPSYLEASMANFRKNREHLQAAFAKGIEANPLAKMAEANFKMMQNAAEVFIPGTRKTGAKDTKPDQTDELAQMREQMAAMQKKLDELSK